MEGIGGFLVILFMIISFISKAQKKAKDQQQPNNSATRNTPLQSQLNRAMEQINDIKNVASEQIEQFSNPQQSTQRIQPRNQQVSQPAYRSSLEGHKVEGHKVEGYKMEGAQVEGYRVEGHKVEGIQQKHNTSKFSKNKVAVTESSMKRGYAGEGCDEHYNMELAYTEVTSKRSKRKSLHFSDNPIVQGIVMSQIIERPRR